MVCERIGLSEKMLRPMRSRRCSRKMLTLLLAFHVSSAVALHVRIGTRPSPLAVTQAEAIAAALTRCNPAVSTELVKLTSSGESTSTSMAAADFAGSIDEAVVSGVVDVGVHSLKDLPPMHRWQHASELSIGCHLPRECPSDVLVGASSVAALPAKSRVGSSSVRRRAQWLALRPDVQVVNLRGNVGARLDALESGEVDALLLAAAGLERLGLGAEDARLARGRCELSADEMLSACAQGIVGAVCRRDADDELLELLVDADEPASRLAAAAELAFLSVVDSAVPSTGRPPLAAYLEPCANGGWDFHGLLARPDGSRVVRVARRGLPADMSEAMARAVGADAAEDLLEQAGADLFDSSAALAAPPPAATAREERAEEARAPLTPA